MRLLVIGILPILFAAIFPTGGMAQETFNKAIAKDNVKIFVAKDLGRVVYDHSKSREQFSKAAGKEISRDTLGLTIAKLQIDGTTETNTVKVKGGHMVYLSSVNVQLFYGDIMVLIDKRYPVGTCEYNAIIAHENKHVSIARLIIDFYTPYVKREAEKIVGSIDPVIVRSPSNAASINRRFNREIQDRLQPMIALIQEQLDKGNAKLDTPEAYVADTAMCHNW